MGSIYDFKPKFQGLLRPLANTLAQRGWTANQVTLLALVISIFTGLLAYLLGGKYPGIFWLLPIVLFIRMALNAIDGMLAREHQMQSKLGGILNEVGDVISDSALYLPFVVVSGLWQPLVITSVILAILTEFVGILGQVVGDLRRYDGPLGKSDRAFLYGLTAIFVTQGLGHFWLNLIFIVGIVLLVLTIWNRAKKSLQ
ncbi:CDP-alcohol phosphatidyltransferase family protein [bacterium]|nr:CDP-alcohol phosphatidyltransferase family protein [bacterium]